MQAVAARIVWMGIPRAHARECLLTRHPTLAVLLCCLCRAVISWSADSHAVTKTYTMQGLTSNYHGASGECLHYSAVRVTDMKTRAPSAATVPTSRSRGRNTLTDPRLGTSNSLTTC